jgi:aspartyl protease/PDZ domain-containing protein
LDTELAARSNDPPAEIVYLRITGRHMQQPSRIAFALALGLLTGHATTRQGAVAQPPAHIVATIPFDLAIRHVVVNVKVNDSRPLAFVLDTGASAAIVRMDTARELGLSLYGTVNTGGAGPGTQAGQRVKNASWSLVGLDRFSQPVALALPLGILPSGLGREIDGIIGGEFIKQFVVALDYQARVLELYDRRTFRYDGKGEALPLEFTPDGHPVVRAAVTPLEGEPIDARFMLDIGSGLALALHSPFVSEHNLLSSPSPTIRAIGLGGAGGTSTGRLGRVASIRLGSFTIDNPITLFSGDKGGAFANAALGGNIGAQITRRFRLIFDYAGNRLILEPSPAFAEPFDRAISGLAVWAEGANYRTFRVRDVLEDSPASEVGIAAGDVIVSMGGVPAEHLTLAAIQEALEKPSPCELTIRRGEEVLAKTLTPRRLI